MNPRRKVQVVALTGSAVAGLPGVLLPDDGTFAGLPFSSWRIVLVAIGIAIIVWALMLSARGGHVVD